MRISWSGAPGCRATWDRRRQDCYYTTIFEGQQYEIIAYFTNAIAVVNLTCYREGSSTIDWHDSECFRYPEDRGHEDDLVTKAARHRIATLLVRLPEVLAERLL